MTNRVTDSIRCFVLYFAIAATVLSQIPLLHGNQYFSALYSSLWVLLFGLSIIFGGTLVINRSFIVIFLEVLLWMLFIMGGMLFEGKQYISNETTTLILSLFIALNGFFTGSILSQSRIKRIIEVYIICTAITAISVYNTFYRGVGFTWENDMKNSFAPILLTAVILLLFFEWKKASVMLKYIRFFIAAIMIGLIFLIRSRATLVCFFVTIAVTVFYGEIKNKYKMVIVSLCIGFALLLLLNDSFYDLIIRQVFLSGRQSLELDSLSSGRVNDIIEYYRVFNKNLLFGIGSMYLDCFYVLSIYQYGIIGGILVICIGLAPLLYVLKNGNRIPFFYKLIVICFSINGLFEGLTPIGPGVKCMLLWFLFGVYNKKVVMK